VIQAQEAEQKFCGKCKRNPTKDLAQEKGSQDEDIQGDTKKGNF
jgi:hypothetical protein